MDLADVGVALLLSVPEAMAFLLFWRFLIPLPLLPLRLVGVVGVKPRISKAWDTTGDLERPKNFAKSLFSTSASLSLSEDISEIVAAVSKSDETPMHCVLLKCSFLKKMEKNYNFEGEVVQIIVQKDYKTTDLKIIHNNFFPKSIHSISISFEKITFYTFHEKTPKYVVYQFFSYFFGNIYTIILLTLLQPLHSLPNTTQSWPSLHFH